jgi:hypothetical protein
MYADFKGLSDNVLIFIDMPVENMFLSSYELNKAIRLILIILKIVITNAKFLLVS